MSYTIGVVCSVGVGVERGGRVRNEDNYLICADNQIAYLDTDVERRAAAGGDGALVAVCDGMGGHEHGNVASNAAVRVMAKLYRPGVPKSPERALLRYVQDAHQRLHEKAHATGPVKMGTTLTAAWLLGRRLTWIQVGDSRLYLFRDNQLVLLTPEHTRNEFARRDGMPVTKDGNHLVQNFIYGSRGLGDDQRLRLQKGLDVGSEPLMVGDRLLLCTDGLHGAVDDVSIGEVIRNTRSAQATAVACMEKAVARGALDNITVMVVDVGSLRDAEDTAWDEEEEDQTYVL